MPDKSRPTNSTLIDDVSGYCRQKISVLFWYKDVAKHTVMGKVASSLKNGYGQMVLKGLDTTITCAEYFLDILDQKESCCPRCKTACSVCCVDENYASSYTVAKEDDLIDNAGWQSIKRSLDGVICLDGIEKERISFPDIKQFVTFIPKTIASVLIEIPLSFLVFVVKKLVVYMQQIMKAYTGHRYRRLMIKSTSDAEKIKEISARRKVSPKKRLGEGKTSRDIRMYLKVENSAPNEPNNPEDVEKKRKHDEVDDEQKFEESEESGEECHLNAKSLTTMGSLGDYDSAEDSDFDPSAEDVSSDSLEYAEGHTESDIESTAQEVQNNNDGKFLVELKPKNTKEGTSVDDPNDDCLQLALHNEHMNLNDANNELKD